MGKFADLLRGRERVVISATKIRSARVLYESQDIQRTEMTIDVSNGAQLVVELTPDQTRELAQELIASYRAIRPEFKM